MVNGVLAVDPVNRSLGLVQKKARRLPGVNLRTRRRERRVKEKTGARAKEAQEGETSLPLDGPLRRWKRLRDSVMLSGAGGPSRL
jgi:hypothetical protein